MKTKNILLNVVAYILFIINAYILVQIANIFGLIVDNLSNLNIDLFRNNLITLGVFAALSIVLPLISYQIAFKVSNEEMNELKKKKFMSEFGDAKKDYELIDYTQNLDIYYSGQLLNRFNFINIAFVFIFSAISIISIDFRIFIIALFASALPLIIPALTQNPIKKRSELYMQSSKDYAKFIEDKLGGKGELIRYDGISWASRLHAIVSKEQENRRESFRALNIFSNVFSEGISSISQVIIMFVGGMFALNSVITVGEVITLIQLMGYLASPIVAMISLYNNYVSSIAVKARLEVNSVIENIVSDFYATDMDNKYPVELKNLDFSYGERVIFNHANFKFEERKSYLIRGKSGSGKSTLLKLIAGELDCDEGMVYIYGREINHVNKEEIYNLISYISQDTHIFNDSVGDNILLGKNNIDNISSKTIETLELELSEDTLLNTDREISGGEVVRIGVGRFLTDPKEIVLLDEHTAGLNSDLAFRITKKILDLNKTVICISHTDSEYIIQLFDVVIDMEDLKLL